MWTNVVRSALVCVRATRWKRASKCKNLIMQFQAHLINQKNRRHTIIKQSRADIAQLLQIGSLENALARVDQLYKDTCLLDAYDQIEHFCECIITNLSHVSKCSSVHNLPTNASVAVASLTYAASRCGELSQLHLIRNLFRERYGREFDIANVELSAGNFVDFQLTKNLTINVVPEDEKFKLYNEIAQDQTSPLGFKDLKRNFHPQLQDCAPGSNLYLFLMHLQSLLIGANDYDEVWVLPPRPVTHRKVWPTSPRSSHIDCRRSDSSKDPNSIKVDYQESSSTRTSSEGMLRTPRMSIAYFDDIDEKSVNQEEITGKHGRKGLESWDKNLSPMSYVANKRKVVSPKAQVGHSTQEKNRFKMAVKNHRSLDSSNDKWNAPNDKSCLGYVHPNLPYYEEVAIILKGPKGK